MNTELNRHELWDTYNTWYANNRESIKRSEWNLVPSEILLNPEKDTQRGLNLISFLTPEANQALDHDVAKLLRGVVSNSGWFVPVEGRHITILDIIPHNAGKTNQELDKLAKTYQQAVSEVVLDSPSIPIIFSGVFASPDGITVQGFPVGDNLRNLRSDLRKKLAEKSLLNFEEKKYLINTAHVALVKFTGDQDGHKLLSVIDNLRHTPPIHFQIQEAVLNISSRYDKTQTIKTVKKWRI